MQQDNSSQATLAELNLISQPVTTRTISWLDMAMRAWGAEWNAPDHAIYEFSQGRRFDSTDKGLTGIYGVEVYDAFEADIPYGDVDSTLAVSDPDVTNLLQFDATAGSSDQALLLETGDTLVQENGYRIIL